MISRFVDKLYGKKDRRLLFLALDNAGRTTILYKLKLGEVVTTIPTIGFNVETVEYNKTKFTIWDVGGRDKIRPLWRHYYQNTQGVCWVIDSTDRERIGPADGGGDGTVFDEMWRMLDEPELTGVPLLVWANKQDLSNAMSPDEIATILRLDAVRNREVRIQACCAHTGDGLYEGLDWMKNAISSKKKTPVPQIVEEKEEPDFLKWIKAAEAQSDDEFMQNFADRTLKSWDHGNFLRVLWIHINKYGRREGMKRAFRDLRTFFDTELEIAQTFSETLTYFWYHLTHYAIEATKNPEHDFKGFLILNPQLTNTELWEYYFNKKTMQQEKALTEVVLPDKKSLPSMITKLPEHGAASKDKVVPKGDSDQQFLEDFENNALDRWNHHCLLRVIWLYITTLGRKRGVAAILEKMKGREKGAFHFTITYFWIQMVHFAIARCDANTFPQFLSENGNLDDQILYMSYYSKEVLFEEPALQQMVLPDLKPLPSIVGR